MWRAGPPPDADVLPFAPAEKIVSTFKVFPSLLTPGQELQYQLDIDSEVDIPLMRLVITVIQVSSNRPISQKSMRV